MQKWCSRKADYYPAHQTKTVALLEGVVRERGREEEEGCVLPSPLSISSVGSS